MDLKCPECDLHYDMFEREPMSVSCCWITICKRCVEKAHGTEGKQHFTCPKCQNDENVKFGPNMSLKPLIAARKKEHQLLCEDHKGELVTFYCTRCKVLTCDQCLKRDHNKCRENGRLREIPSDAILKYVKTAILKMKKV